ncbi:kinase domain protein [Aaosphaeria arxii CBS 175.79]|uniref:EKC/KEOPS complex subunit BUD32 n=1 Tax=Aaosphaeria arxii CBS 175.79 TaxID=1450172 RepID=A0A6A5Y417_9PLEO|nr:kinase domain protein [Aaosphaeria arxii CBS 175.79]KAF2019621.1 kinase domain protein [Aaosphaeria arxii CBS 175.79]
MFRLATFTSRVAPRVVPLASPLRLIRFFTSKPASDQPFEEESLPWYNPNQFYPVRIGEILDSRYKVLGKLGYGAYSTVWLCRDVRDASFAAIKVCTRNVDQSARIHRELEFYEHVSSLDSQHPGQRFIRGLLGTFEISSPTGGQHLCLVHPPMHMTIRELQYINPSHKLNEPLLKWTLHKLLTALSFLHDEANVVHTDITPSNIMMTVEDESILDDFEKAEIEQPSPTKPINDTHTIYTSRKLRLPKDSLWGQPVLCDFGQACIGAGPHRGLIQPEVYRAPEVLFDMGWSSSADIWNVAVLIWDLFENRHLFNARDEEQKASATHHVAEMVAYMGLPSREYVRRSEVTRKVFDDSGRWKGAGGTVVPQLSLEESVTGLDGEAKERFLGFVRSMLEWEPEKRKSASELLEDPWMVGAIP